MREVNQTGRGRVDTRPASASAGSLPLPLLPLPASRAERGMEPFKDPQQRLKDATLKRLHEACRLGRSDDVQRMMAEVTEIIGVNDKDPGSGWTALHFACLRGNVQIVKELLKFSADVHALDSPYCQTPLHISSKYAHAEVSRILVLAKADPSKANMARKTPLQVAMSEEVKAVLLAAVNNDASIMLPSASAGGLRPPPEAKKTGTYTGRLEDGKIQGPGVLEYDDGGRFEGEWFDGKRHGKGSYVSKDGEIYEGEWSKDDKHGHGLLQDHTGAEYLGEWINGKRQGRGRQIWASGAKYDGDFYNDLMHGQGLLRYENGDQYEGGLFDGQRHGKGRMIWKEGHWYEGEWLRDRRHGEGLEQLHGHTESGVKYSQGSLIHRQPLSGCPYHYALVITIAFYKQKFRLFNSDRQPRASAFGRILREPLLAGYPVENVMTLTDEEATKEAIERAIERLRTSTSSNATVVIYFDGCAAEIATGPEAGYYLCPYDYDSTDRPGSSITCFKGHGSEAGGFLLTALSDLPAGNLLVFLSTCTPDTLDRDAMVGSPYFREKFFERLHALQGRAVFSGCKMDEPTYTGTFANLIFNALAGVRDEDSDIDNQVSIRHCLTAVDECGACCLFGVALLPPDAASFLPQQLTVCTLISAVLCAHRVRRQRHVFFQSA